MVEGCAEWDVSVMKGREMVFTVRNSSYECRGVSFAIRCRTSSHDDNNKIQCLQQFRKGFYHFAIINIHLSGLMLNVPSFKNVKIFWKVMQIYICKNKDAKFNSQKRKTKVFSTMENTADCQACPPR